MRQHLLLLVKASCLLLRALRGAEEWMITQEEFGLFTENARVINKRPNLNLLEYTPKSKSRVVFWNVNH